MEFFLRPFVINGEVFPLSTIVQGYLEAPVKTRVRLQRRNNE